MEETRITVLTFESKLTRCSMKDKLYILYINRKFVSLLKNDYYPRQMLILFAHIPNFSLFFPVQKSLYWAATYLFKVTFTCSKQKNYSYIL